MNKSRKHRLGSGFERLEERRMNAVMMELSSEGTFYITGDENPDSVQIEYLPPVPGENGVLDKVAVTVEYNNPIVFYSNSNQPIKNVRVDLGGGDDTLSYKLGGNGPFFGSKQASISLGPGADSCLLDFRGGGSKDFELAVDVDMGEDNDWLRGNIFNASSSRLSVSASLGEGDDEGLFDLRGVPSGKSVDLSLRGDGGNDLLSTLSGLGSFSVAPSSQLSVDMHGGAGNDTLKTSLDVAVNGALNLAMNGDSGQDKLDARIDLSFTSRGRIDAQIFGGADNDSLMFLLNDYSFRRARIQRAVMDGGLGTDWMSGSSSHVKVTSVEVVPFAPTPRGLGTKMTGGTLIG